MLLFRATPAPIRSSLGQLATRSLSSATIKSKLHPGLYYHRHPHSPQGGGADAFLVSYLPTPPPSLKFSPTTIGTLLHPKSRITDGPPADEGVPPISPRTLTENPDFVRLVHEVIAMNLGDDAWFQTQAKSMTSDTHIHIADQRQPSDANRIPDPQDILGSVLVQSGHLVPASYEPNHVAYRLVTEAGLLQLPGQLQERLREACERVYQLEKEAALAEEEAGQGQ